MCSDDGDLLDADACLFQSDLVTAHPPTFYPLLGEQYRVFNLDDQIMRVYCVLCVVHVHLHCGERRRRRPNSNNALRVVLQWCESREERACSHSLSRYPSYPAFLDGSNRHHAMVGWPHFVLFLVSRNRTFLRTATEESGQSKAYVGTIECARIVPIGSYFSMPIMGEVLGRLKV